MYNTTFKNNKDECIDLEWTRGSVFGEQICHSFKDMLFELNSGGAVNPTSLASHEMDRGPAERNRTYTMKLEVTNLSLIHI